MNEIEQLRELRAGLPAARTESRAAARAGLMAQVEHAQGSPRRSPWRGRRLRLAVAGVALTALLVALPIALFGGGGGVQPAVAQVLQRAAEVAAAQEPLDPRSDQYVYTRSESAYLNGSRGWSVLVPSVREAWISLDGSRKARIRGVTGKPRFVSADQRAGWVAAGRPPLPRAGAVEDTTGAGGGGIIPDAEDLPTDPETLRELIEAREIRGVEGPPGEAETFVLIGDMLRSGYLPPAVRAALYEATAELPEVELLGEVSDPAGRPGVGIAYADRKDGTRHELIFDPETSALLGERMTLTGSRELYGFRAPPGTTIGYVAYLESRVVDSVGKNPPPGAGAPETSNGCYERASLHGNTAVKHGIDPIATCAKLWREGVVGDRPGKTPPNLVACVHAGTYVAHVFPGPGPELCARLDLVPFDPRWRE